MKFLRYFFTFAILLCCLAACSDKEESKNVEVKEAVIQEENSAKEEKVEYPEAPTTPEEIVQQPPGIKLTNASIEKEELENYLTEFETEGLEPEQIYNGLVHWFGYDYQEAYEGLSNFEPDFGELDISKEQGNKVKNIAIHLDSSGSMAGQVSGGVKMNLAKTAIKKYASGLPKDSIMSLRVYGHKGTGNDSDKSLSCSSTEVMYAASKYDEAAFSNALEKFKPSGWTPLAASIKQAYEDLNVTATEQTENILFIVSDGIETCDGNPVEEARKLAESDLNIKVNIIGFNVDDEGQKQLKETAAAGNGEYFTVNSNIDFNNTIEQMLQDARKGFEKDFETAGLSTKINFRVVEIAKEIRDLGSRFADVYEGENSLLSDASYELYLQEKISEEDREAIALLINQRYETLNQFKESLLQEADGKKEQKHQELLSLINGS